MTTTTKVVVGVVGVAAAIGIIIAMRRRRAKADPKAMLTELQIANCNCFSVDLFPDGTTKSTRVSRRRCEEDGLAGEFSDCPPESAFETVLKVFGL